MPRSTVCRDAADMLGYGHENADALWKQFLTDGSVLVWDGTTNGKGSENYVDDARKLGPEHLNFIDDFISETHAQAAPSASRRVPTSLPKSSRGCTCQRAACATPWSTTATLVTATAGVA